MNRFEVQSRIRIYERNGEDIKGELPTLKVSSHSIYGDRVVITDPAGVAITVIASDLLAAIKNATNAS